VRSAALIITLAALVAAGWLVYETTNDEELGERAEAIAEDPEEFFGQRVTVTGEVESFYPGAFTLGDGTYGEELLVVPAEGVALPRVIRLRSARPDVRVTGTVERKGENVELVPGEAFEPLEGAPFVRATRIELVQGG
jgi:hypothetical protein